MKNQDLLLPARIIRNLACARGRTIVTRTPRLHRLGLVTMVVLMAGVAFKTWGFLPPERAVLPNYDRRRPAASAASSDANQQQAVDSLKTRIPSLQFSRDRVLGTPRFVSSSAGFLTGPQGMSGAVSPSTSLVAPVNDPHRVIKDFISEHAALFGHNADALAAATIKRDYVTAHNGMRTVVWEQVVDDISVFEGLLVGHITRNGELVSVSSRFVPDGAQAAAAGTPDRAFLLSAPAVSAAEAVAKAAANIGTELDPGALIALGSSEGAEKRHKFRAARLRGEAHAKLVWLPMDRNNLRLCWRVEVSSLDRGELYSLVVDARTGEVLVRRCLTNYLTDATYRVFTSDSPSPFSPGHPIPSTTQPALVQRQLVTWSALSTNASPNGWIDDGDNETRGNNVDAHMDADNDDQPDLPRPQGSPNRVFDFPLDLNQAPDTYTNASVVQLFYWNNWMHDRLYALGFTEAAGNFQNDNFGRGGLGNDAVEADAQDGGGFNNANFGTPPDGSPGRMQMYIFDGPNPDRDGDLDAEIVLHEYTHGLSNRLVGGGVGIFELQPAGMGEGWSDFYAIALLSEPADDVHGNYAAGAYASYQFFGLNQNYYFGIRRYPYTTDMTKNPLTLKDIDPTRADPHIGVPISPLGGGPADEVHNQGEVWCVTLWEARANLVEKLGYDEGNRTILQLVTDGMKLSPVNPTFLEARDAIIKADEVLSGGDNRAELWIAFAKRGMGFSASVPPASTTIGVVEAFDLPDDVVITVPDGIMDITVTPPNRGVLFAGASESIFVRITDGLPVTNATINTTLSTGGTLTFRNDGVSPDQTANNSIYSASFNVPTNAMSVTMTFVISAPNKVTATNVVTYSIVPLPTNDNFANAIKVPPTGAVYVSNNKFATTEVGEPFHGGSLNSAASLWWTWSSPTTTNVLVDTSGSLFDSVISVYTGNQLNVLTQVASANDVGIRRQAYLTFTAAAGVTYKIAVASASSASVGSVYLRVAPGGQPDITPPVVTVSFPRSGFVTATNRLVMTGTAADPQPNASGIDRISIFIRANEQESSEVLRWSERGPASAVESTNWSAIIALSQGLNIVRVNATDVAGNISAPVLVQVTYRPLDPINDIFANALELTGNSGVANVNTLRATKEFGEPDHAGNAGGKSAWWFFRAPADGTLFLSTTNSTFDTLLAMYQGIRVNSLTNVASNDDALDGVTFSKITQAVRANEIYRIAVDGFDGASGAAFLSYNFTPSTIYLVSISTTPGGSVNLASGEFAAGTPLVLQASPDFGFEFVGWEGSVVSTANPLSLVVNGDLTLTARFSVRTFTDGFESGNFSALPWTTGGNAPWIVQTSRVSIGSFAARSGVIANNQRSSLVLSMTTAAGIGSFDFLVSSETGWDWLEFYVNGALNQRWSGEVAWQTHLFALSAGTNTLEWRYAKDFSISLGSDAAFIDNVDLPLTPTVIGLFSASAGGTGIQLQGQRNHVYVIQASADLKSWQPISTNTAVNGVIQITDPRASNYPVRFYRAVIP